MRRLTQTLTALVFAATALAVAGRPAAANEIDSYRDAMKSFAPVISDWLGEVDDLAAAAVVKPEVVEGPALAELARRGHGIAEDLAGRRRRAPTPTPTPP